MARKGTPVTGPVPPFKVPLITLCLYVSGTTAQSSKAIVNIRQVCEEHLRGRYDLRIVDVKEHPELAAREQLIALPTLVKKLPKPESRFIGDLSNTERLLSKLNQGE
jgi:circadian clock protein KaiB